MEEKELQQRTDEINNHCDDIPDEKIKKKKPFITPKKMERFVTILLGITTLLSAWASWIGHLHGGLQSINFTESNNAASEGTAAYNLGMQAYLADYMSWNTLNGYYFDLKEAKAEGDQERIKIINEKIESFKKQNVSNILAEGIEWMEENNEDTPFKMPGLSDKYFESADETIAESQRLLEEGKRDNTKGDSYMLATVIFSLTLFLLGIIGSLNDMPNKIILLCVAAVCLIGSLVYMSIIPLPTGFAQMNFFKFGN